MLYEHESNISNIKWLLLLTIKLEVYINLKKDKVAKSSFTGKRLKLPTYKKTLQISLKTLRGKKKCIALGKKDLTGDLIIKQENYFLQLDSY